MHWWFSGRIAACHAVDPGSIPGQCTRVSDSIVVSISACHADDRGSIPRLRATTLKHGCSFLHVTTIFGQSHVIYIRRNFLIWGFGSTCFQSGKTGELILFIDLRLFGATQVRASAFPTKSLKVHTHLQLSRFPI